MSNYKALGIEKEIKSEFSQWQDSDLKKLIDSEYFYLPHISKRAPSEYCNIRVIDCQNTAWWYNKLIGFEFFCKIEFFNDRFSKCKEVKRFIGIKLTNSKEIIFRDFDPKDVSII